MFQWMKRATLLLAPLAMLLGDNGRVKAGPSVFGSTGTGAYGTIQTYTITTDGIYRITAAGAQGGSPNRQGGKGAFVSGEFSLVTGTVLQIAVGQKGSALSGTGNGGGGGGTFIVGPSDTPLLIAGGGGGTRAFAGQNGIDGQISEYGTTSSGASSLGGGFLKVTDLGQGGKSGPISWGSGGGGFYSDGVADPFLGGPQGGKSWFSGLTGGTGGTQLGGEGGFGGGGSGAGSWGGGGGGGYSGGDGGWIAGGGGSYNTGSNAYGYVGYQSGNGAATIELLSSTSPVPEPASMITLAAGAIGMLGFRMRKRRLDAGLVA